MVGQTIDEPVRKHQENELAMGVPQAHVRLARSKRNQGHFQRQGFGGIQLLQVEVLGPIEGQVTDADVQRIGREDRIRDELAGDTIRLAGPGGETDETHGEQRDESEA